MTRRGSHDGAWFCLSISLAALKFFAVGGVRCRLCSGLRAPDPAPKPGSLRPDRIGLTSPWASADASDIDGGAGTGSMPIGRDAEAARIGGFLDEVPRGPRVLLIEGEAGIGKTTLLKEGHDTAIQLGITVLSAYPVESEMPLEFAGLADLLQTVPAVLVDGLPDPQRQAVRQVVLRTESGQRPADPRTMATAVLTLLRNLSKMHPVVIVVDDLAWLDTTSARALSFALRGRFPGALPAPGHPLPQAR